MSALNNSLLLGQEGGGGYSISRSLRFNSSDSAYLSRTPASAGNRKTWTWAGWVKRSKLGQAQQLFGVETGGDQHRFGFSDGDTFEYLYYAGAFPLPANKATTQVFRDPSAWLHLVVVWDTTNGTASDRMRIYVNGVRITAFSASTDPSSSFDGFINSASYVHRIAGTTGVHFNGLLADIHFIDGQALDPTSFGEFSATTGVWMPKAYTGTYGTNGFKLNFSDNSTAAALGTDSSGAGNTWNVNNISVTAGAGNDSVVDVPTNGSEVDTGSGGQVRGNYCTLNPLQTGSGATLSNGNLDISTTSTSWQPSISSIFQSSGKWYAEFTVTTSTANSIHIGIVGPGFSVAAGNYIGVTATSYAYRADGGTKYNNASQASYGASYTTGDVIGVAMDLDAGTLVFYKNGTSQGTAYTGMTGEKAFAVSVGGTSGTHAVTANFGQRPFAYTAPSGFKALCTANLPAPVVTKPSTVMDALLYTGNGGTQTVSGLGFSPDLVWTKARSAANSHALWDTVRGVEKRLMSNATDAEATRAGGLTAFTSSGFTHGNDGTGNDSSTTYAAWCWDAGSSTVTNTAGSISSQVRTNGYLSIVTWSGTASAGTIGHGLGVAPQFIIVKNRSVSDSWYCYHVSLGNGARIQLNETSAQTTGSSQWNSTSPTSTVFSVGAGSWQASGNNLVTYCFAPVAGYSSFGSYVANGVNDGPFIYLGFRPKWIMIKAATDTTYTSFNGWLMIDAARYSYNGLAGANLFANASYQEGTGGTGSANPLVWLDILSNGFKIRRGETELNFNGTYLYCAFAESPFQYARAR